MSRPHLDRAATCSHEAGHVAAMCLYGHLPAMTRADFPDERSYGTTLFPWEQAGISAKTRLEFMVAVLAGPLAAREPDWPPQWPPRRGDHLGDENQLACAVSLLGMEEPQWDDVVEVAVGLTETQEFRRLHGLIARALEINETLSDTDLRILLGPDRLEAYGIPAPTELVNEQE